MVLNKVTLKRLRVIRFPKGMIPNKNGDLPKILGIIPVKKKKKTYFILLKIAFSGKLLHNHEKLPCYSWENSLFPVTGYAANYQRVMA